MISGLTRPVLVAGAVTVMAFVIANGESEKAPSHDRHRYETGGIIQIDLTEGKKAVDGVVKLRDFLWRNWVLRKRAIIATIGRGIDSPMSKVLYSIEPNDRGVWQLVIESLGRSPSTGTVKMERFIVYDLTRVEIVDDGYSDRTEIPDVANRRPESFHLILKEERGRVLEEL